MHYVNYTLTPHGILSARAAAQPRHGVLIRNDEGGYGCLQTWTELGDESLDVELEALKAGQPMRLGARALRCASLDADARAKNVSLFEDLLVPKSHATLPISACPSMVHTLSQRGFTMGKLKVLPYIQASAERLMNLAVIAPSWTWRLDFNATLTPDDALQFWNILPEALRERIDFVEDPCPYDVDVWQKLQDAGMPLAFDLPAPGVAGMPECTHTPMHRVVKPARDRTTAGLPVFTSYMDHPVGQVWAAYCAAKYYTSKPEHEVPLCGLITHHLYEPTEFSRCLGLKIMPDFPVPEGPGLGFGDILEKLDWQKL